MLTGLCVPQMGMHSLLTSEMESTGLFRGTMVIGYYQGKPVFIEPMITKEMLLEQKAFELPIPAIPGLAGNRPRSFRPDVNRLLMAREARRLDALLHEALPRLRTPVIVGSGRRGFIWFAVIRVVFRRLVAFVAVRLLVHRAGIIGICR